MAKTLYEKLFDAHVVFEAPNETPLLYIDRHLVHEVTSPQAFDGLRAHHRPVRQPGKTFATMDHNVSTQTKDINASGEMARIQMQELIKNCNEFGVELYDLNHPYQGIVHVMGPEQGVTLPGMTIVCGDSHTATHGAFGALAFGIGTSEVEHVLATQTLKQGRAKTMKIEVTGNAAPGITAKDIVLAIIGKTGSAGGTGHVVEFCGDAIRALSMEGRMTLCNMAIEMGAKAGLVAPDETTFNYVKGRLHAPKGRDFDEAVEYWKTLKTDDGATFDTVVTLRAEEIAPQVTWGTNPGQVISVTDIIPDPASFSDPVERASAEKALAYMGLQPGVPLTDVAIDKVFIGSCTNSRIEDLRAAAEVAKGRKVAPGVQALVVPGSGPVKAQAEAEGLDKIFIEAGFEWRLPGCSMCLAMNNDRLNPGERCASTSNRNFEGRQGRGGALTWLARRWPPLPPLPATSPIFAASNKETTMAEKFTQHTGLVVPLDAANVDTDAIIPKQFLQKVTRTGFGAHLFNDWRFLDEKGQQPNPEFVLNFPEYQGASILLARENFGCGSSREHAPWALTDYGFKVVIAPSFADIFYGNSFNNQLLPVTLSDAQVDEMFALVKANPGIKFEVDLEAQVVKAGDKTYSFKIDDFRRHCMLNGLDSIGLTLQHEDAIAEYENKQPAFMR